MNKKETIRNERGVSIRILKESLIGPISIVTNTNGLLRLSFISKEDIASLYEYEKEGDAQSVRNANKALEELELYFTGKLKEFSVQTELGDLTTFQKDVLQETAKIPFGEVMTYGEIAIRIGKPNAARAVGGALARNPISIVIPCHRVIGYDKHLHGFSSPNGITAKAKLLLHEGVRVENSVVQLN